jgi:hypothetical protein
MPYRAAKPAGRLIPRRLIFRRRGFQRHGYCSPMT